MRELFRWFWNYRVAHTTVNGTTTFEHRLFRRPLVRFDKEPVAIRCKQYDYVVFDEAVEMTPEMVRELEKLNAKHPTLLGDER